MGRVTGLIIVLVQALSQADGGRIAGIENGVLGNGVLQNIVYLNLKVVWGRIIFWETIHFRKSRYLRR